MTAGLHVLVFGANGQVGHALAQSCPEGVRLTALDRGAADFTRPETLRALVQQCQPDVIVNAAAYTAVDKAENEHELAFTINTIAPGVLAEEAALLDALLIHYSTDYVFDGRKAGAYIETDPVHPLSVYGQSKQQGETAVAATCPRHLILRTSWVVGKHGNNFLKTMVRLARSRDSLSVVADQWGAPTSAELIALVTWQLVAAMQGAASDDPRFGLYHLAAAGETSWHGYACQVIADALAAGAPLQLSSIAQITAIPTSDYPLPAPRPQNSRLDTRKLCEQFQLVLPAWQEGVKDVLLHHLETGL